MSLFKGILNIIKKPIAFVAKTAGTLVGLPALGTLASNVINSIGGAPKVKQMAVAAAASGAVDTTKVAETLVANNVAATPANIAAVSSAIPVVAAADPTIPNIQKASQLPISDTANKLPTTFKLWNYIKSYWYLALPSGLLVVYLVYKSLKK